MKLLMHDINELKPGNKIERVLLYFRATDTYMVWNKSQEIGTFLIKKEGEKSIEDYPDLWIELD